MDVNDDPLEDCSEGGERGRVNPREESQDSAGEDSAGESIPDEVLRAVAEVDRSPGCPLFQLSWGLLPGKNARRLLPRSHVV